MSELGDKMEAMGRAVANDEQTIIICPCVMCRTTGPDPTDLPDSPQIDPEYTYKGQTVSDTSGTIQRLRTALKLSEGDIVTQQDVDAWAQLNSPTDPMREAMLGFKQLGEHPKVIAAVFCAMAAEVRERIYGYGTSADCFCRVDQEHDHDHSWSFDPQVVRFIYDAVKEKMKREELPQTLEHSTLVAGQRLTVSLHKVGAKDYEVAEVNMSKAVPF